MAHDKYRTRYRGTEKLTAVEAFTAALDSRPPRRSPPPKPPSPPPKLPPPPPKAEPVPGTFKGRSDLPDPLAAIDGGAGGLRVARVMARRMEAELQIIESSAESASDAAAVFRARKELVSVLMKLDSAEKAEQAFNERQQGERDAREQARQIKAAELEVIRLQKEELLRRRDGLKLLQKETVAAERAVEELEAEAEDPIVVSPDALLSRIRRQGKALSDAIEMRVPGSPDGARVWEFGDLAAWGRHPKMREILEAIAAGRPAQAIAETFKLSPTSVARIRARWREHFGEAPPTPVGGRKAASAIVEDDG